MLRTTTRFPNTYDPGRLDFAIQVSDDGDEFSI